MGIGQATFCNWKKKYGRLGPSELRQLLRQLQEENTKLKRILADLSLDKAMQQDLQAVHRIRAELTANAPPKPTRFAG
jgi:putative transposase